MEIRKSHGRCSFPYCKEVENTYVFEAVRNSGIPPVILCEKHVNEMREAIRDYKKKEKTKEKNTEETEDVK